jgi:hypothetical protein
VHCALERVGLSDTCLESGPRSVIGGGTQRILYRGRWWLPPSPGCGESSESVLPVACPNTKGVSESELTLLWLVLCRTK